MFVLSWSVNPITSTANTGAKEYVESLHQNSKSQLIYGKNNVVVKQKDQELFGYLSLHDSPSGLVLKWTPNQMMNGVKSKQPYWDYALNVDLNTIVYLHCHQSYSEASELVLVACDGVQHSPVYFPTSNSLFQFLSCLSSGLEPDGKLEPALVELEDNPLEQEDFVFKIINTKCNGKILYLN